MIQGIIVTMCSSRKLLEYNSGVVRFRRESLKSLLPSLLDGWGCWILPVHKGVGTASVWILFFLIRKKTLYIYK